MLAAAGASPVGWLSDASWAFFWCVFVSICAYGLLHTILLAGLQAILRISTRARKWTGATVAAVLAHYAPAADAQPDCRWYWD